MKGQTGECEDEWEEINHVLALNPYYEPVAYSADPPEALTQPDISSDSGSN